jgi:hypothetical protein
MFLLEFLGVCFDRIAVFDVIKCSFSRHDKCGHSIIISGMRARERERNPWLKAKEMIKSLVLVQENSHLRQERVSLNI